MTDSPPPREALEAAVRFRWPRSSDEFVRDVADDASQEPSHAANPLEEKNDGLG